MNTILKTLSPFLLFSVLFGIVLSGNLWGQEQKEVPVIAESYPVPGAEAEVLILSRGTEFKEVLRSVLIEQLNSRKIGVTIDKMANADSYDPAAYDAVLLLSGIEGFRPLPEAINYIVKHDYPGNIIYVSTYTLFAAPYGKNLSRKKVDAITAASKHVDGPKFEKTVKAVLNRVFALAL